MQSNIVLMITDDQDYIVGGWDPMHQTHKLVQQRGVTATEWRIHTPICAPSRSELFSGRYFHNIRSDVPTPPTKGSSGGMAHVDYEKVWSVHFAGTLREKKGYTTAMFGKCMNGNCAKIL